MKARAIDIIKFLSGNLTENHYVRVLNGELVIQRRPKRTKPATEAQIRARRELKKNTQVSISLAIGECMYPF